MPDVRLGELIKPARVVRAGDGALPLLSMTMHGGLVDQAGRFKKRIASEDTSDYKVVERGQLVVGFPIDEGVLDFQDLYPAGIVSPAYGIWDLIDSRFVDREFLRMALRSPRSLTYYRSKLRGSTARRRSLPTNVFLELPISLPPIAEQRRIAAILDAADALRAKRRALLGYFEALERALFESMFGGVPARRQLGSLISSGPSNGLYRPASDYGSGVPILRIDGFDRGFVRDHEWKRVRISTDEIERFALSPGDLVVNRVNALSHLGKTAIIRDIGEPAVYESNMMRLSIDSSLAEVAFVNAWFQTADAKRQILRRAKKAINQASINQTDVRELEIPDVPLNGQREFALRIRSIDSKRATVEKVLAADDELFASLQSRAFSGGL